VGRRLREEIDAATRGRPLSARALHGLEYLDRVLKESMRLYCPVPGFVREVKHDRSVVLGNVTLPPAAQIFIVPWTLHRNPRLWPDPLRFDPDRFLAEPPPGHYMPFGLGPRTCAGAELTMTCAKGMLVSLLSRYTVSVRPGFEVDIAMGSATTYPRDGLPARLGERSRSRPAGDSGSRQTPSSP
jgi:cytochrome P450